MSLRRVNEVASIFITHKALNFFPSSITVAMLNKYGDSCLVSKYKYLYHMTDEQIMSFFDKEFDPMYIHEIFKVPLERDLVGPNHQTSFIKMIANLQEIGYDITVAITDPTIFKTNLYGEVRYIQMGNTDIGAENFKKIIDQYNIDTVCCSMEEIMIYGREVQGKKFMYPKLLSQCNKITLKKQYLSKLTAIQTLNNHELVGVEAFSHIDPIEMGMG